MVLLCLRREGFTLKYRRCESFAFLPPEMCMFLDEINLIWLNIIVSYIVASRVYRFIA